MFMRSTNHAEHEPADGACPERMSVAYVCLIAVVAVLAGVVIALIGA